MGAKTNEVKVYFPPKVRDRWDDFVKICAREGTSASEKIRDWVIAYVDKHKHGNPQTLLDRHLAARNVDALTSLQEGEWPELSCELRNTWGRCRVLLEPCSREVCPRLTAAYRKHLEDPDMALDPPPKRTF